MHALLRAVSLCLSTLAATAAFAGPPVPSLRLEIGGAEVPYEVELALPDRGCAVSSDSRDRWQHEVKVCREGGDDAAPVLSFEILRSERGRDGVHTQRAQIRGALPRGQRTILASQRGEGTTPLLVSATLR